MYLYVHISICNSIFLFFDTFNIFLMHFSYCFDVSACQYFFPRKKTLYLVHLFSFFSFPVCFLFCFQSLSIPLHFYFFPLSTSHFSPLSPFSFSPLSASLSTLSPSLSPSLDFFFSLSPFLHNSFSYLPFSFFSLPVSFSSLFPSLSLFPSFLPFLHFSFSPLSTSLSPYIVS